MAELLGLRIIEIKLAQGADYIIPNTNIKALVLFTFAGTSTQTLSIWNRNNLSSIISGHKYYSIGTTAEGTICLNKDESNNFVVSNKMDSEITVKINMLYLF